MELFISTTQMDDVLIEAMNKKQENGDWSNGTFTPHSPGKAKAAMWRTKPINHYNEMVQLFGKDMAIGVGAGTIHIATALVCLATNRTYNFPKMIFNDETAFPTRDVRGRISLMTLA
nr:hypothetical protein [Tanacetum cinerariifolium]